MNSAFLDIGLILFLSKILSIFTRRVNLPQVIGPLFAGLLLGPSILGLISYTDTIRVFSEFGVVMLLFTAGLETSLKQLKEVGLAAFIIAMFGVILPLAAGTGIYLAFFPDHDAANIYEAVFVGVVLTATSVSITVEALREMGKLNGKVGTVILGAAVLDDIIGILVLTFVASAKDPSSSFTAIGIKTIVFLIFTIIIGIIMNKVFKLLTKTFGNKKRISIMSLSLCLLLAFLSEEVFGISDITGAYFAGIMLSNLPSSEYITDKISSVNDLMFTPVFFAAIGLQTSFSSMNSHMIAFSAVLLIAAALTKVIGCGAGARICKFTSRESLQVGIGMMARGEVALVVAQKGMDLGVMSEWMFTPIIILIVATALITPIFLKISFKEPKPSAVV